MNRLAPRVPARPRRALCAALICLASLGLATPAGAVDGTVTVSATNNPKISINVSLGSANFGTNLDPSGVAPSGTTDTVAATSAGTGDQGVYYVWQGSGSGATVTVKSNRVWNGTVGASESGGTSTTMTVASGALRYYGSAPTDYAGGAGGTAFAATPASWQSNHAKGSASFTYYYGLRVDWTDADGSFSSTITYSASQ